MWYIHMNNDLLEQGNLYTEWGQENSMQMGETSPFDLNRFRREVKQHKEKYGQFLIIPKPDNQWDFIVISGDDRDKWFLYHPTDHNHSIIHRLKDKKSAWYHNSHNSAKSTINRMFDAVRTYDNNLNITTHTKDIGTKQKLLQENVKLHALIASDLKTLEIIGLLENPQDAPLTYESLKASKFTFKKKGPDGNTKDDPSVNRRLEKEHEKFKTGNPIPRDIHAPKIKKKPAASTEQGDQDMHTSFPTPQTAPSPSPFW